MKRTILWSLRLGFSSRQADAIHDLGLEDFLDQSFKNLSSTELPDFMKEVPQTPEEMKMLRIQLKNASAEKKKEIQKKRRRVYTSLNEWWLQKMMVNDYPLHEKMTLFWQNHFVVTSQKVKTPFHIYQFHQLLENHAFGNFKTLTKLALKSNAMIRYLDNHDNRKGKINENLSRELLELFTLGIGNYTEKDIRNGAKALSGLGLGNAAGEYRSKFMIRGEKEFLGQTGNFNSDDVVDIIFEQEAIPYRITKKIIQWFLYDDPNQELVRYYGDYFRKKNFEIKPLLKKMFLEEFEKNRSGAKIKDPLVFGLQTLHELQMEKAPVKSILTFLENQGMKFYGQRNVKGWEGGNAWLNSHTFLERQKAIDLLCSGKLPTKGRKNSKGKPAKKVSTPFIQLKNNPVNRSEVIEELCERMLFKATADIKKDMHEILKNDFDPQGDNAQRAVLRLVNFILKTPEYQLI